MPRARWVIVNADDLGRTTGINAGIFEAHSHGIVTSATLMVGFPAAEDAARELAEHPALGVGLHVTLTGGEPPLSSPADVPSLVDQDGRLARNPEQFGELVLPEVIAEVRLQHQRFLDLVGRPPTHLDSHHHAHRHPVVEQALIEVAREADLPIRCSSPGMIEDFAAAGVRTTDAFVERFFGDAARREVLLEILEGLQPGVTEIMCHPAYVDDALRRGSSYTEARAAERAVLTDPSVKEFVRDNDIQLMHFGAL
jgi:predicted glycoside hydrolase/deacetylase ChbG (UPF0249 family)